MFVIHNFIHAFSIDIDEVHLFEVVTLSMLCIIELLRCISIIRPQEVHEIGPKRQAPLILYIMNSIHQLLSNVLLIKYKQFIFYTKY